MAKSKLQKAEEAVANAKTKLDEANKTHAPESQEVKDAAQELEVAEGNLTSARGNSGGKADANRQAPGKVQSEAAKNREEFKAALKEGVKSNAQAEKIYALSSPIVPGTPEDQDPLSWAYVTFDGNIFFAKKAAIRHGKRLSGGVAQSPAGKYFSIKIGK